MSLDFTKQQQLMLQINLETRYQQDDVITRIREMVKDFRIAAAERDPKKSPFRNVLNVATEPSASLETVKTYIRYQSGRRETNKVWIETHKGKRFAEEVTGALDNLRTDVDQVFERVEQRLADDAIQTHLAIPTEKERLKQDLHLKLVQLYLGYLYREHTAAIGESTNNGGQSQGGQRPPTNHQNRQPAPAGRPQPRN
jgi:hypothetical protein